MKKFVQIYPTVNPWLQASRRWLLLTPLFTGVFLLASCGGNSNPFIDTEGVQQSIEGSALQASSKKIEEQLTENLKIISSNFVDKTQARSDPPDIFTEKHADLLPLDMGVRLTKHDIGISNVDINYDLYLDTGITSAADYTDTIINWIDKSSIQPAFSLSMLQGYASAATSLFGSSSEDNEEQPPNTHSSTVGHNLEITSSALLSQQGDSAGKVINFSFPSQIFWWNLVPKQYIENLKKEYREEKKIAEDEEIPDEDIFKWQSSYFLFNYALDLRTNKGKKFWQQLKTCSCFKSVSELTSGTGVRVLWVQSYLATLTEEQRKQQELDDIYTINIRTQNPELKLFDYGFLSRFETEFDHGKFTTGINFVATMVNAYSVFGLLTPALTNAVLPYGDTKFRGSVDLTEYFSKVDEEENLQRIQLLPPLDFSGTIEFDIDQQQQISDLSFFAYTKTGSSTLAFKGIGVVKPDVSKEGAPFLLELQQDTARQYDFYRTSDGLLLQTNNKVYSANGYLSGQFYGPKYDTAAGIFSIISEQSKDNDTLDRRIIGVFTAKPEQKN